MEGCELSGGGHEPISCRALVTIAGHDGNRMQSYIYTVSSIGSGLIWLLDICISLIRNVVIDIHMWLP